MEDTEKWNNIRWGAVLFYLALVFTLVGLLFVFPSWETGLGLAIMVVSIIGIVPLIAIINIPFIRMVRSEVHTLDDRTRPRGRMVHRGQVYSDSVRMNLLIWTIVPLNLFLLIMALTSREPLTLLFTVPIILILTLSLVFFWKLDIWADGEYVSFHFGPFGRTLSINEIRSIEAIVVHPIRDFMGWGWRSGSDGSIGYIAGHDEGVRIVTKRGRRYTITCHQPEDLVRIARRGIKG